MILYLLVMTLNACTIASGAFAMQDGLGWSLLAASLFMAAALFLHAISPFLALN